MTKFTLCDFKKTYLKLTCRSSFRDTLASFPGMQKSFEAFDDEENQLFVRRMLGIIDSMTYSELESPEIINAERSRRISQGSGTSQESVVELLRTFENVKNTMFLPSKGSMKTLALISRRD